MYEEYGGCPAGGVGGLTIGGKLCSVLMMPRLKLVPGPIKQKNL